jgi:hypothetical protein
MFSTLDVINEESQTRLQLSGELTLDDSRKQHHNITTSFHLVAEAPQHHLDFFIAFYSKKVSVYDFKCALKRTKRVYVAGGLRDIMQNLHLWPSGLRRWF